MQNQHDLWINQKQKVVEQYCVTPKNRAIQPISYTKELDHYDFLVCGDESSEKVHSFVENGESEIIEEGGVTPRKVPNRDGAWIQYKMLIPKGNPFTLRIEETYPDIGWSVREISHNKYDVEINGKKVYIRDFSMHGKGGVVVYEVRVEDPDLLISDTIQLRFVQRNGDKLSPSIYKVWVLSEVPWIPSIFGGFVKVITNQVGEVELTLTSGENGSPFVIFDFGVNIAGNMEMFLTELENNNLRVNVSYSESLRFMSSQGDFVNDPVGLVDEVRHISVQGTCHWKDPVLRGGFRFAMISLQSAGSVKISLPKVHYKAAPEMKNLRDYKGYFKCNDELLNKIWFAGAYTAQLCTIDPNTGRPFPAEKRPDRSDTYAGAGKSVIVDGGKRDRAVWGGDLAGQIPVVVYSTSDLQSLKNSIITLAEAQKGDGMIPAAGPPIDMILFDVYHVWWLYAYCEYYRFTGDKRFLEDYYPNARKAADYLLNGMDKEKSLFYIKEHGGDWGYSQTGYKTEINILVYKSFYEMANIASILDEKDWSVELKQWALRIKDSIRKFMWDEKRGVFCQGLKYQEYVPQDANSLAILFNLVSEQEAQRIIRYFKEFLWTPFGSTGVDKNDGPIPKYINTFASGFEVFAHFHAGCDEDGLELIRREWGHMLTSDWGPKSTFWENIALDGSPQYGTYTSFAHAWGAGPTAALTEKVLGVQPAGPGFSNVDIIPHPGDLTEAEGLIPIGEDDFLFVEYKSQPEKSFEITVSSSKSGAELRIGCPTFGKTGQIEINGQVIWDGKQQVRGEFPDITIENHKTYCFLSGLTEGDWKVRFIKE
jgi:hypothetical protein